MRDGEAHLVPYAGLNLIRFNGIRNFPISASDSRHPDKNPRSLNKLDGENQPGGQNIVTTTSGNDAAAATKIDCCAQET
ncbi:hypothetical protein D9M71_261060 [compost metagenome]